MNIMGANPEAAALISEAASILEMLADKDKALEDCISRIKGDTVKDRLQSLQQAMTLAHSRNDEDNLKALMTEYNALVKTHKT